MFLRIVTHKGDEKARIFHRLFLYSAIKRFSKILHQCRDAFFILALASAVLAVYSQVCHFDFVCFDDHLYVLENSRVRDGLTLRNIGWAFGEGSRVTNYWVPLTWLSFMAEYEFFGFHSGGYHFTNLCFHLFNSIFLFFVLRRLTGASWRSFVVSALFAVHPLHVESVAWVTERKDVLMGFFAILSLGAYAAFAEKPSLKRYLCLIGVFLCALMSKPMAVILPFVFFLLDFWPLNRFVPGRRKRLVLEKLPLMLSAAGTAWAAWFFQSAAGATSSLAGEPLISRLTNAVTACGQYVLKLFWPHQLAVLYPFPSVQPVLPLMISALFLTVITVLALRWRRRLPWWPVGWLWFLGGLVPVSGIVPMGPYAMADRYFYIPGIGLYIVLVWGVHSFLYRRPLPIRWVGAGVAGILIALAATARVQCAYWRNSETLFRHTLAVTQDNYIAHNNLGLALAQQRRYQPAVEQYLLALAIKPGFLEARHNLGASLEMVGSANAAKRHYTAVLESKPDMAKTRFNLARILASQGSLAEAAAHYQAALRIHPEDTDSYLGLACVFVQMGKNVEACQSYETVLRLNPENTQAKTNLGALLLQQGRTEKAGEYFMQVLAQCPADPEAHNNLGIARMRQGKIHDALYHLQWAVQLRPNQKSLKENLNRVIATIVSPDKQTLSNDI